MASSLRPAEAWRLLHLPSAPSVPEVKAAYRRLAKEFHPDLAASTTRTSAADFARITEAYVVALAEAQAAGRRDATRPLRAATPARAPRTGTARQPDAKSPRARPGSTTYEGGEQADGEDPPWDGARWVGADSGTYWTVNPREYADPRKHGPEYRARGRRPVRREARSQHPAEPVARTAPVRARAAVIQGAAIPWLGLTAALGMGAAVPLGLLDGRPLALVAAASGLAVASFAMMRGWRR